MYVRWKKRKSVDKHPDHQWQKADEVTWSAELVENKRIEGQPRQKVIAFLGSIKKSKERANVTRRYYFWYELVVKERRFEKYPLYELPAEQKRMIVEALRQEVPLSEEEFRAERERTRPELGEWSMPRF